MNLGPVLKMIALLCGITSTVVGFIDAFSANPALSYPWAVPAAVALVAAGITLVWFAEHVVK